MRFLASGFSSTLWKREKGEKTGRIFAHVDWFVLAAALTISALGLLTMRSFPENLSAGGAFFERQIVWIALAICAFFIASLPEYRFLRRTPVVVALYGGVVFLLGLVLLFGSIVR